MADDREICGTCKWSWKEYGYWTCRNRYSEKHDQIITYEERCNRYAERGVVATREAVQTDRICNRCKWLDFENKVCINEKSRMYGKQVRGNYTCGMFMRYVK